MFDPIYASASEIARAIREGKISAVETLEAHLARIARLNPAIHAIVTLDEDGATRRAQEADDALARGELWGPLHGVPMTIFDHFPTAGIRTTEGGNPKFVDYVPTNDATIVARCRDAGAVFMGKSNDAHDFWGETRLFPLPRNPWGPDRMLDGAGGPVAAVAAGFTSLDFGADAGSVQIPASIAGVFALRPTEHRIPIADIFFANPVHVFRTVMALAPVAHSVADLGLAFEILAGPDRLDTDVPPVSLKGPAAPAVRELRIAWTPRFPGVEIDDEIARSIESFARTLENEVACVDEVLPKVDYRLMVDLADVFWSMQVGALREIVDGAPGPTLGAFLLARQRQDEIWTIWDDFMRKWDILLAPVTTTVAPLLGQVEQIVNGVVLTAEQARYASIPYHVAVITGLPTVVTGQSRLNGDLTSL